MTSMYLTAVKVNISNFFGYDDMLLSISSEHCMFKCLFNASGVIWGVKSRQLHYRNVRIPDF